MVPGGSSSQVGPIVSAGTDGPIHTGEWDVFSVLSDALNDPGHFLLLYPQETSFSSFFSKKKGKEIEEGQSVEDPTKMNNKL